MRAALSKSNMIDADWLETGVGGRDIKLRRSGGAMQRQPQGMASTVAIALTTHYSLSAPRSCHELAITRIIIPPAAKQSSPNFSLPDILRA